MCLLPAVTGQLNREPFQAMSPKEQEYRSRIERIRARFKERKLDAIFVTDPLNVAYVSAFWEYVPIRMEAVLIPLEGECVFIVSKNEYEYACKVSWIKDIRYY